MRHPVDILVRVEADVHQYARQEDVLAGAERLDTDGLSFEVAHRADALCPKQHKAADVDARQQDDGVSGVHLDEQRGHEIEADVGLPGGEGLRGLDASGGLKVLDVGEPLAVQEILRYVLRGDADAGDLDQFDLRRLRRRLRSDGVGARSDKPRRHRHRQPTHELPSAPALRTSGAPGNLHFSHDPLLPCIIR